MAIHRVRTHVRGPAPRLASRLERRAVEDIEAIELVRRHVARLGRRRLAVPARPAHALHRAEIRHVLLVIDLVEGCLVIVPHVHPHQIEPVSCHVYPPNSVSGRPTTVSGTPTASPTPFQGRSTISTQFGFLPIGYSLSLMSLPLSGSIR